MDEVEGVILDHYFLRSEFTEGEIRLILEVQLFNKNRTYVQISQSNFKCLFEQYAELEECGIGYYLDLNNSYIHVVFEEVDAENSLGKFKALKPRKIKHYPRSEWIDVNG